MRRAEEPLVQGYHLWDYDAMLLCLKPPKWLVLPY